MNVSITVLSVTECYPLATVLVLPSDDDGASQERLMMDGGAHRLRLYGCGAARRRCHAPASGCGWLPDGFRICPTGHMGATREAWSKTSPLDCCRCGGHSCRGIRCSVLRRLALIGTTPTAVQVKKAAIEVSGCAKAGGIRRHLRPDGRTNSKIRDALNTGAESTSMSGSRLRKLSHMFSLSEECSDQ